MEKLIQIAADEAMRAAIDYAHTHHLKFELDAMVACLRSWVKAKLQEALHDAKEAIDANMGKVAEVTFLATMRQAGIEAAKEACFPA